MKILVAVLIVLLAIASEAANNITVDGRERSYLIHLPKGYSTAKKHPVVMVFHGGGSNATSMRRYSGMDAQADRAGFIAVYPNGAGRLQRILTFNGGNCCGYAMRNKVDDVAFVNALLDQLIVKYSVDAKRIYATGLSNGGIISYYLADKLAHRITAIAPIGGTMGTATCKPSRPVPVMHMHGTADANLPYGGGRGKGVSGTKFYSVKHSVDAWIKANRCDPKPTTKNLPDRSKDDCTVTRLTYSPKDKSGAPVVEIRIHNGGHTWPGAAHSPRFLGRVCEDINANDLMWDFFKQFSLP